jgi:hypothetical protein
VEARQHSGGGFFHIECSGEVAVAYHCAWCALAYDCVAARASWPRPWQGTQPVSGLDGPAVCVGGASPLTGPSAGEKRSSFPHSWTRHPVSSRLCGRLKVCLQAELNPDPCGWSG